MFANIFSWFFALFGNTEKMVPKRVDEIPIASLFCPEIRSLRGERIGSVIRQSPDAP
jgi:hypothetical protein